MASRRQRPVVSIVLAVLLAGCASGAGRIAVSPDPLWLHAWQPPPEQACSVSAEEPLPPFDAVFDSARVASTIRANTASGAAVFSISISPPREKPLPGVRVRPEKTPVRDSVRLVETDLAVEEAQRVRQALLASARAGADEAFVLRVDAGPEPRFRLAHPFECPPALVNRELVGNLLRAVGVRGLEGQATVQVWVREDGSVGPVAIERGSGHAEVDRALLEVARAMRFHPARLDRVPVAVAIQVPLVIVRN